MDRYEEDEPEAEDERAKEEYEWRREYIREVLGPIDRRLQ